MERKRVAGLTTRTSRGRPYKTPEEREQAERKAELDRLQSLAQQTLAGQP